MSVSVSNASNTASSHRRLFTRLNLPQLFKATVLWLMDAIAFLSGRRRFLMLSPPLFGRQLVFDRKQRSFFALACRNYIDWATARLVFGTDSYALDRLTRIEDLERWHQRLVQSGKTPLIIDCGANVGYAARRFQEIFPKAHVLAVEPDRANAALLRVNTIAERTTALEAAIGGADGRVAIANPSADPNSFQVRADDAGTIAMLSIPTLLSQHAAENCEPFLIKIDIEGFERDLFAADPAWIDRFPILIIELHDYMLPRSGSSNGFLRAIAGRNRDFVILGENIVSLDNSR